MRKLIGTLVVLIVLAVAVDRIGALVAQHEVAVQLKKKMDLSDTPKVTIHGIPFLTQVIDGKYDDIQVRAKGLHAEQINDFSANVHLHGAKADIGDLIRGKIDKLPVDRVSGTVDFPYDDLATASKITGLTLSQAGNAVRAQLPTTVAGQAVTLTATVQPELTVQNSVPTLSVKATSVGVNGISLPPAQQEQLQNKANFSVKLSDLPFGVQLQSVKVQKDGLRVSATAKHITLRSDMSVDR